MSSKRMERFRPWRSWIDIYLVSGPLVTKSYMSLKQLPLEDLIILNIISELFKQYIIIIAEQRIIDKLQ